MTHRVKQKTVHDSPRGAKKLGTCSVCGENVPVVWSGLSWRCIEGERLKQAAKRKTAADYALKKNGKPRKAPGKATGKSLTRSAERLARWACIEAAGHRCQAAGLFGVECGPRLAAGRVWPLLEWCHIKGRGMGGGSRLKYHPENAVCLCGQHHIWFTSHDLTFKEWIDQKFPGRIAKLAELERILPQGSGNDAKFWAEYYREQGVKLV